jgi:protein involved in polysaccharide export with SLBB domain
MSLSRALVFALLVALAVALAVAPSARGGLRAEEALRAGDVLRVGDVVTIQLPGEAAVSKDYQIDRRGRVALPEVGVVQLAGRTLEEATKDARAALSRAYRDLGRLTLVLKERRLPLTVLGYVRNPGPVELPGEATLQMAIMASGGLLQGAQLDRVIVTDVAGKRVEFDYKAYLDSGDESLLPKLKPLDQIFVPASPLIPKVQVEFDGRTLAQSGDGADEARSVKVFGEVGTPAVYSWKPGMTVIDILMRAGGVTRYSSVEQIRILNKAGPVVFNLQAYLDSGDAAHLPAIEPGATIFVPKQLEEIRRSAQTVYVMGEVAKPGAFEGKPGATFIDILANAGGPTRFAETRQIRVIRADGSIAPVDLPRFTELGGSLPPIHPGDTIFVPEKIDNNEPSWLKVAPNRAVQVLGAVMKPGRYEWSDEMSLFDLIATAGGPLARSDITRVQVTRQEDGRARAVVFDMAAYLTQGGQAKDVPVVRAGDVIMIPELPNDPSENKAQWVRQSPEQSIYVMGQVVIPGRYAFNDKLGFLDILTAANGPTSGADLRNLRVTQRGRKGAQVVTVNLARYFATGDESILPKVRPGDVIYVPDRVKDYLDQPASQAVRVMGAINRPGRYPFSDNVTLLDLLAEAGGPTGEAMQDRIVVVQIAGQRKQARVFSLVDFVKTGDLARVPLVRGGDLVYVPRVGDSAWRKALDEVRDGASALSVLALVRALGL